MKFLTSTICRTFRHARANRRVHLIVLIVLAALALLGGPAYPGCTGTFLVVLLAGLSAVLGWAGAESGASGIWGRTKATFLARPVPAMFAFFAFVLVVGQHPGFLHFVFVIALSALAMYLGGDAQPHADETPSPDEDQIGRALALLEGAGFTVTKPA